MMVRKILNTLASLALLASSGMAYAQQDRAEVATLVKVEGTVMVDQGKGFVSFKANAVLREGDRIITLGNSRAEIVFKDNCRSLLEENNMMTIVLDPGCLGPILALNGATIAGSAIPLSKIALSGLASIGAFAAIIGSNDDKPISGQ